MLQRSTAASPYGFDTITTSTALSILFVSVAVFLLGHWAWSAWKERGK